MPLIEYQLTTFIADAHLNISEMQTITDIDGDVVATVKVSFLQDVEQSLQEKTALSSNAK